MFPACGGTAPEFTSVSVLVSDPFGDSAGAGPTGAWTGGDAESIGIGWPTGAGGRLILRVTVFIPGVLGMGRPTGAVARLTSIVTVSITAILALGIALGWTSAVVAVSTAARPECAQ